MTFLAWKRAESTFSRLLFPWHSGHSEKAENICCGMLTAVISHFCFCFIHAKKNHEATSLCLGNFIHSPSGFANNAASTKIKIKIKKKKKTTNKNIKATYWTEFTKELQCFRRYNSLISMILVEISKATCILLIQTKVRLKYRNMFSQKKRFELLLSSCCHFEDWRCWNWCEN